MSTKTLLIVDDEACITFMLASRFRELGYEVVTAGNGDEAMNIVRSMPVPPTAVISDFQMPQRDGLQLARELRSEPRTASVPVIMLTARGHRLSPRELQETGIQHVMPKPFSARELQAMIVEVCGEAREAA
ncbi:MAG: response regulator [Phycisphaeraceae bacterium]|nr:response regulator [Phycisphaeraceae bacterium]